MTITNVFQLFCGVGLFLYGIRLMGEGLNKTAGDRLKHLLGVLTKSPLSALLVGTAVTALIQSSAATTVMTVGFINSGLMSLNQAVGIIMGANIGTTFTSVLIAIDFSAVAPVFVFIGAVMLVFTKREHINSIGTIVTGFGMLFLGMNTMSASMEPLRDSPMFSDFILCSSNPVSGIIIGFVMTAVIQSSSATVGILQALASRGLIPFSFSAYVLFGQNIGAVATTMLSTAGTSTSSKRAALIHLLFNLIGTAFFVALSVLTPYISLVEKISPDPSVQISAAHIIFNVGSTALLFPFSRQLVKLSQRLIKDRTAEA